MINLFEVGVVFAKFNSHEISNPICCIKEISSIKIGLDTRKPVIGMLQITQAQTSLRIRADQPAHPRSLISAFVIRFLERIISRLASSKISIF